MRTWSGGDKGWRTGGAQKGGVDPLDSVRVLLVKSQKVRIGKPGT